MSFGSVLKRALGFGGNREIDDDDLDDLQYDPVTPPESASDGSDALAGELFSAVITLFNDWQPQFVRDCISTEAQRRFLYNSLSAELRRHIGDLGLTGGMPDDDDCRRELQQEVERLTSELRKTDDLRNTLEQTRLSAERQKRALSDRVVDLTQQVAALEEKNERYILSGASGAAKGSIAEVERLTAEVERLTTLNEQLDTKARMSDAMLSEMKTRCSESKMEAEKLAEQLSELGEIHQQLDKVEQVIARKDAVIAELNEKIAAAGAEADKIKALEEKIASLKSERETLRKTIETNLYNQAHSELNLRKQIKTLEAQLASDAGGEATDTPKKSRRRRKADTAQPDTADEPDFGYKAPQRPRHRDDDSQMSLF